MITKLLYFAYGSNLLEQRLRSRVGNVKVYNTYKLKDYELYITSIGWADVRPKKGSFVEGVLYELTPFQLSILDRFEACYGKEYFIVDGIITSVYIYYPGFSEGFPNRPASIEYLDCIIQGAIDFGLKDTATKIIQYRKDLLSKRKKSKKLKVK